MSVVQEHEHSGQPLLDLQNVSKHFGGLAAVQDVNLQIWPGEIISIIEPTARGKPLFSI